MQIYEHFARCLAQLLGDDECVRLHVESFMPLSVEDISWPGGEHRLIALSHTAVQNGDLMRDPEIVFALHEGRDSSAPCKRSTTTMTTAGGPP